MENAIYIYPKPKSMENTMENKGEFYKTALLSLSPYMREWGDFQFLLSENTMKTRYFHGVKC